MPFRYHVLLAALGLGAIPLAWGASESKEGDRIRGVVSRGTEKRCRVSHKFTRTTRSSKSSSRTTTYHVVVLAEGAAHERTVDSDAYERAEPDLEVAWYEDPPTGGFAALEIGKRTDNHVGPYLIGFGLIFVIRMIYRGALPRVPGAVASTLNPPDPGPDTLPPPPRDGPPPDATPSLFPLAVASAGLSAGIAGLFAEGGTWGASLLMAAQGLGALLAVLGVSRTLRSREAALWRDGVEVRGFCSMEWDRRFRRKYEVEFAAQGGTWRLTMLVDVERPLRATQGQPAVVLYDPKDPRKAMLAPRL